MSKIDEIMSDVQSFASTWALVGGRFDDGSMHNTAEAQSAELRNLIAAALADARRDGAEAMRDEQDRPSAHAADRWRRGRTRWGVITSWWPPNTPMKSMSYSKNMTILCRQVAIK